MSLGLVLSGGGAKGAAHIGALQALKEEKINIEYISGTSSGSIVATLFACGYNPHHILNIFRSYSKYISDFDKLLPFKLIGTMFTGKIKIKGLAKGNNLEILMRDFCKKKNIVDISEIEIPLSIPAVDVNSGEIIYFFSNGCRNLKREVEEKKEKLYDDTPTYEFNGNIADIVRASSSFPFVFKPKVMNNRILIDGGVRVNSPVGITKKMGASKVVTIAFDENLRVTNNDSNIINIGMKSFDIMGHEINRKELEMSDLVLRPRIENVSLLDSTKVDYCANQGYKVVKENIDTIRNIMNN